MNALRPAGTRALLVVDRSRKVSGRDGWRSIAMARQKQEMGRSTYHIDVLNNRGKVVEERDVVRRSQEGAHRVARQVLSTYPTGTRLNLYRDGKLVEQFTMTKDGWTYNVLNGDSVRAAQRAYVTNIKAGMPKQEGTKVNRTKASTGKARKSSTSSGSKRAPF